MLTGDNENAAKRVAEELSIDEYHAKLLPQDKLSILDKRISEKKSGDVGVAVLAILNAMRAMRVNKK